MENKECDEKKSGISLQWRARSDTLGTPRQISRLPIDAVQRLILEGREELSVGRSSECSSATGLRSSDNYSATALACRDEQDAGSLSWKPPPSARRNTRSRSVKDFKSLKLSKLAASDTDIKGTLSTNVDSPAPSAATLPSQIISLADSLIGDLRSIQQQLEANHQLVRDASEISVVSKNFVGYLEDIEEIIETIQRIIERSTGATFKKNTTEKPEKLTAQYLSTRTKFTKLALHQICTRLLYLKGEPFKASKRTDESQHANILELLRCIHSYVAEGEVCWERIPVVRVSFPALISAQRASTMSLSTAAAQIPTRETLMFSLDDIPYKEGAIKRFGGKGPFTSWKRRWLALSRVSLSFQSSQEAPLKQQDTADTVRLDRIHSIFILPDKKDRKNMFILSTEEKRLMLSCDTEEEMHSWLVSIDSLPNADMGSFMDNAVKHTILGALFKTPFRGGALKSSYDEEWSYTPSGLLCSVSGTHEDYSFQWDGQHLAPLNAPSWKMGSGHFNGVWLAWCEGQQRMRAPTNPAKLYSIGGVVQRYFWDVSQGEFQCSNAAREWKETRHFLACKVGRGEWIVEGSVPIPLVMMVQMLRYQRTAHGLVPTA